MVVIEARDISKAYTLGVVGAKTFRKDLLRKFSGKVNSENHSDNPDKVWALKNISFDVEAGNAVGIVGKNGAGKSTLLKILSRVTAPTQGYLKARGRIASLLEVGTGFHPELTGRENIFLNGAILGMTRAEIKRELDSIIAFSGVEKYIDTPVKRYSSGMYVRLAFAVAAHLQSEILIMDEVLAVGDAEFQKKCLGKMNDVAHNQGRTVLFVSHNMAAVNQLCNKAIYLKQGQMLHHGTVNEVIDLYLQSDGSTATVGDSKSILKSATLLKIEEERNQPTPGLMLHMEFDLDLPEPRLGIEIMVRNREIVLMTASSAYHSPVELPQGRHKIKFILGPVNFNLGKFDIDLQIVVPKQKVLELHEGVLSATIESQVVDNFYHAQYNTGASGFLVPPQTWQIL